MLKHALPLILLATSAAHADTTAIGEPNVTWEKNSIHVCWHVGARDNPLYAKNDFTLKEKLAVQAAVQREYTIARVGITFTGWEDCYEIPDKKYDLEIYQDNQLAPTNPQVDEYRKDGAEGFSSVIGQGGSEQEQDEEDANKKILSSKLGYFDRNLEKPILYLMVLPILEFNDDFNDIDELQMTALHEFGHVAGLRHEHIRPEALTDPNCKNLNKDFKPDAEKADSTSSYYYSYDPNSIMNYCWSFTLQEIGKNPDLLPNLPDTTLYTTKVDPITHEKTYSIRVGLSAKDIATLREMYKLPPMVGLKLPPEVPASTPTAAPAPAVSVAKP